MQTRLACSRDWMFTKWNPIFVISLRSREGKVSRAEATFKSPFHVFSLQHCAHISHLRSKVHLESLSPVCDKSVRARDQQVSERLRWEGVEGIIRLHLITILPLGLQKAELRDETMWRAIVKEGKRNLSLMGFIFRPPSWCFSLCVPPPPSHPTLQLFSLCRQSAYDLTPPPPPRTARNDIHQKNGTEKNHHETFWSFGFAALAVFHYDKW